MNNMNDMEIRLRSCLRAGGAKTVLVAALVGIFFITGADHASAAVPPIPQGCAVLNTNGKALTQSGILNNPNVDIISIAADWYMVQPSEDTYIWKSIDDDLSAIAGSEYGSTKSAVLRINTMGGAQSIGGKTPDWVYLAMDADPHSVTAKAGVTYSFLDSGDGVTRCIPVFWDPNYLAKKRAMIAVAGAHFTSDPNLNATLKVVVISYANAITEDWYVPNDNTGFPSQVTLWLNKPDGNPAGAGYTTDQMINAAIHQADAMFADGQITDITTLNSVSAAFTQADVGCSVTGPGYQAKTRIVAWISPTQVTLNKPLRKHKKGRVFTIVARKDGLIDVAMAAFPNQYIATAVGGNGPYLDAGNDGDPGTALAETVNNKVQEISAYKGRYIVQRNNITAVIPTKDDARDAWVLLAHASDAGIPTAGQALGVAAENTGYRMNGGNNCDHDAGCIPNENNVCDGTCALPDEHILDRSADRFLLIRPAITKSIRRTPVSCRIASATSITSFRG